jgi:hypothetical protein
MNKIDMAETAKLMADNRRKNFRVTVKPDDKFGRSNEIELSVTHNGFQWTAMNLSRQELKLTYEAIGEHLKFGHETEWGFLR